MLQLGRLWAGFAWSTPLASGALWLWNAWVHASFQLHVFCDYMRHVGAGARGKYSGRHPYSRASRSMRGDDRTLYSKLHSPLIVASVSVCYHIVVSAGQKK